MTPRLLVLVLGCTSAAGCLGHETCNWNTATEPFELGIDTDLHAVVIAGYDHYLAVGASGTVVSWGYEQVDDTPFIEVTQLGDADLHAVWSSGDSWWVVGDAGTVAVSDNAGATWKLVTLPGGTANLHAITSFAGHLVIVGDELVLVRIADGTWIEAPAPVGGWGQLRAVGSRHDRIYAVGLAGAFWSASDPSGEWQPMADGITDDLLDMGPFGSPYAPVDELAIVGSQGTVLIVDASGWTRRDTGVSVDLIDYDQDHALASDGGLYRIDDAGELVLIETREGTRAIVYDDLDSLTTVGDNGLATAAIGVECH